MSSDINGTVVAVQGNAVAAQTLSSAQDGYVLTWDNADGYIVARPTQLASNARKFTNITSNYTIQTTDDIIAIGSISSNITITFPSSPSNGQVFEILTSVAISNNVTFDAGSNHIVQFSSGTGGYADYGTNHTLFLGGNTGFNAKFVFYNVTNKWYIISGDGI